MKVALAPPSHIPRFAITTKPTPQQPTVNFIQIHRSSSKLDTLKAALALIRIAALLVLTGFGIWDVHNLLHDYFVDNRFTAVRSINITDRFPFIGDMDVYLDFGTNPAFLREFRDFDQFQRLSYAVWNDHQQIDWDNGVGLDEQQLSVAALDAYVFYFIDFMDQFGPNYTWTLIRDELRIMNRSWDIREPWHLVDRYIRSKMTRMIDALRTLQTIYGGYEAPSWNLKGSPSKVWLNPASNISVTLPLSTSSISTQYQAQRYALLSIPSTFPSINMITVFVRASGEYIDFQTFRNATKMKMIKIYNTAVFNNEQFPPCTLEFKFEDECLRSLRAKWIAEECQCQPLSDWVIHLFRNWTVAGDLLTRSIDANSTSGFCTSAIYAGCWERANELVNARIAQIKLAGTCRPCISYKNMYVVDSWDHLEYQDEDDLVALSARNLSAPRLIVYFQCTDQTYVLFDDKPQTGWSQLLSQVGGDLGLYIGFSMMTFLELILFVYHVYHEHEEYKNRGAKRGLEWARCFAGYVWSSLTDTGEKMTSEEHEREMKKDLEKEIVEIANEEDEKFAKELGEVERKLSGRLDAMEQRFRMQFEEERTVRERERTVALEEWKAIRDWRIEGLQQKKETNRVEPSKCRRKIAGKLVDDRNNVA